MSAALPLPCTCGRCATVVRIPLFPQRCRCRQRRVPGSGAESLRGPAAALLGGSAVEPGMCGQRRPVETGAWPCCSGPTGSWPRGHALLTPRERQRVRDQISGGTCESCLTQAIGTPDWPQPCGPCCGVRSGISGCGRSGLLEKLLQGAVGTVDSSPHRAGGGCRRLPACVPADLRTESASAARGPPPCAWNIPQMPAAAGASQGLGLRRQTLGPNAWPHPCASGDRTVGLPFPDQPRPCA